MKKKLFISVLCAITITISGCSNKISSEKAETTASTIETEATTLEETTAERDSKITEVVYSALLFSKEQTIEEYVKDFNEKNPISPASVYDDSHYSVMMSETDRKASIEEIKKTGIDEYLGQFVTNEKYEGVFTHFEYDKDLEHITFYVDSTKSKKIGFIEVAIATGIISDTYQALNLVPVDKREHELKIIDESGNIVYPES